MQKLLGLFALFLLSGYPDLLHPVTPFSDEPEYTRDSTVSYPAVDSYEQALQTWKTPEDINRWIAANFSYDTVRAMRLSETQRKKGQGTSIYTPLEFFGRKAGVCVDLARFTLETLRKIDPKRDPKYLMIEFDPIQIEGNTLRQHWLVSFKREGKIYFFSDSKRPGHIAGPYNDVQAFTRDYEQYRGRRIVSFRELESYQRQRRALKRQAADEP
jgi:hypothetical protein